MGVELQDAKNSDLFIQIYLRLQNIIIQKNIFFLINSYVDIHAYFIVDTHF